MLNFNYNLYVYNVWNIFGFFLINEKLEIIQYKKTIKCQKNFNSRLEMTENSFTDKYII